jgi:hypothetical protein
MTIWNFFSCKNDENKIENKYVKIEKLNEYQNITDIKNDDILNLVKFSVFGNKKTNGGLQSILCIDNGQYNFSQTNYEFVKTSTPEKALQGILKSIEENCADPNFGWKKFKIVNEVKGTTFKGYKAAMVEFEVEENVDYLNLTIKKRIKRYTVFVKNDLWNIVLSPTKIQDYEIEMKDFENMIETLEIK